MSELKTDGWGETPFIVGDIVTFATLPGRWFVVEAETAETMTFLEISERNAKREIAARESRAPRFTDGPLLEKRLGELCADALQTDH